MLFEKSNKIYKIKMNNILLNFEFDYISASLKMNIILISRNIIFVYKFI